MRWLSGGLVLCVLGCTTTVDPETARPYPCHRDGGDPNQCPGPWHCGLEGFCHAPNVPAAYLCSSDSDCEGWHCGTAGICYDLADAGASPCRSNGDCAPGWRCGLNSICHNRDAGAPYACKLDSDCEVGWRCGPDLTCVDPSGDALRSSAYQGPLDAGRLSPLFFDHLPQFVAASAVEPPVGTGALSLRQLVAVVIDGELRVALLAPQGGAYLADGGWSYDGGSIYFDVKRVTLTNPGVTAIAAHEDTVYLADPGGLSSYQWTPSALVLTTYSLPIVPTQLRIAEQTPSLPPTLIAFSANAVMLLPEGQGAWGPFQVLDPTGQALPIQDATLAARNLGALLVATSEGLFAGVLDAGTIAWAPVAVTAMDQSILVGNTTCGEAPGLTIDRLFAAASGQDTLGFAGHDGSGREVVEPLGLVQGTPPAPPPGCDGGFTVLMGFTDTLSDLSCSPCPPGTTVVDEVMNATGAVSRCRSTLSNGAVSEASYQLTFSGSCQFSACAAGGACASAARTLPQAANPTLGVLAGEHGELWLEEGTDATVAGQSSGGAILLDEPFGSVLRPEAPVALVDLVGRPRSWALFPFTPQMGFASIPASLTLSSPNLRGPVAGEPDWTIALLGAAVAGYAPSDGPLQPTEQISQADTLTTFAETAEVGTLGDGGRELVMTSFDELLGGRVLDGGSTFAVKVLPAPGVAIQSIAVRSAQTPTDFLQVYVLTPNGLFLVTERSEHDWEPSPFPIPAGDWRRVWVDGARGRLGSSDGTVLALPSRVPIAEPFNAGTNLLDFAQLCGQAYAVTDQGLYRLDSNPDGGPLGVWARENFDALLPGGPQGHFANASIQAQGGSIYVSTAFGTTVQLTPEGPCQ